MAETEGICGGAKWEFQQFQVQVTFMWNKKSTCTQTRSSSGSDECHLISVNLISNVVSMKWIVFAGCNLKFETKTKIILLFVSFPWSYFHRSWPELSSKENTECYEKKKSQNSELRTRRYGWESSRQLEIFTSVQELNSSTSAETKFYLNFDTFSLKKRQKWDKIEFDASGDLSRMTFWSCRNIKFVRKSIEGDEDMEHMLNPNLNICLRLIMSMLLGEIRKLSSRRPDDSLSYAQFVVT